MWPTLILFHYLVSFACTTSQALASGGANAETETTLSQYLKHPNVPPFTNGAFSGEWIRGKWPDYLEDLLPTSGTCTIKLTELRPVSEDVKTVRADIILFLEDEEEDNDNDNDNNDDHMLSSSSSLSSSSHTNLQLINRRSGPLSVGIHEDNRGQLTLRLQGIFQFHNNHMFGRARTLAINPKRSESEDEDDYIHNNSNDDDDIEGEHHEGEEREGEGEGDRGEGGHIYPPFFLSSYQDMYYHRHHHDKSDSSISSSKREEIRLSSEHRSSSSSSHMTHSMRHHYHRDSLHTSSSPPPPPSFRIDPVIRTTYNKIAPTCDFWIDWNLHPKIINQKKPFQPTHQAEAHLLTLDGILKSRSCGVKLAIRASSSHHYGHGDKAPRIRAAQYTAATTALALAQVALLVRQMEATSTPAAAARVSLLMLGQQALLDAYLCLLHLTLGIMNEPLFNAFATVAFFLFVIFAFFEMRFLLLAWKARRSDPWTAQRQLALIHARFYGSLLAGVLLSWAARGLVIPLAFLLYSFWIPQIAYTARCDAPQPLLPMYIIGTSIARLVLPLYLLVFPGGNQLGAAAPSPIVTAGLALWVGVQAMVLLSQRAWGPRWFISDGILPPRYDYHRRCSSSSSSSSTTTTTTSPKVGGVRKVGMMTTMMVCCDIETGDLGGTECVICMNLVDPSKRDERMVTPCDHIFHKGCLEKWLAIKLVCPTCRSGLPPP